MNSGWPYLLAVGLHAAAMVVPVAWPKRERAPETPEVVLRFSAPPPAPLTPPEPEVAPPQAKPKRRPRPRPKPSPDAHRPTPPPEPAAEPPAPPSPPPAPSPPEPVRAPPAPHPGDVRRYGRGVYRSMLPHRRYPLAARKLRLEGRVLLRVRLRRDGRVLAARVHQSSGHKVLDDEALRMLAAAAPFASFPENIARPELDIVIPMAFRLQD